MFPVVSAIFSLGVFNGFAQTSHHIAAANIQVIQNDTGNTTNSVTVSTSLSINDMRIRAGSTRADYNVQIGPVSADDVTNGILIGSIDQNGRDNGEEDTFPGINYGTVAIDSGASGSPGSSGEWWLPVFQVPSGQEYNFNVAAAWFPYSDGWYGGWLNNASGANSGANNQLIGNPNLVLGTHVVDQGGGKTKVDLRAFGLDSRSNAVLLVVGGKNEANYALSATNSDGTWTIFCHDDNKNGGSYEQDYVGFVCVPLTNHAVVSGKLMGDGSVAMSSQMINVAYWGVGTYHLSIPGVDPASGVLIISAEGGVGNNVDNIVSYQISGDGWDIQTRDLTAGATPASQTLDGGTPVASFVFITPTTGQTALRWLGTPTTNWDFSSQVWRAAGGGAPTNYSDGCTAILDDTASSFLVNATTAVAPYPLVVSNNIQDYVLGGVGSITGSGGLIKQGTGKLALALANNYTGDTVISAGTVTVGATGAIPGGAGYGNAVVNGVLDLAGFDCTLNNLSGSGVIDDLSAAGTPHLTIHETGNTTFSGLFKNTTGSLSFRIEGGGSLILRGSSSFSGACTVSNATLVVDGSIGARPVTIQSGGTLAGTGSLSSPVSMEPNSGFRLIANAPLSVGPLTLNGSVNVSMTGVSLTRAATYVLLQHGAISGSGSFQLVMPPGLRANGFTGSLVDTGTQLKLVVSPSGITGTIADVRHVVILMDENRSFDHYFGSFHGTRGFADRNAIQLTNGFNVFYQPTGSTYELPFHTTLQCLSDLNHSWPVTHSTVNNGRDDQWIPNKKPETMCYYQRADLPYFYALADAYTICDEYHCSVLSSTFPNRFSLMTGMIDPNSTGGGPEIDNSTLPNGFRWRTYPEFLTEAGISWKVFFVTGSSSDNILPLFAAYKQAQPGSPLYNGARVGYSNLSNMVNGFVTQVASNTLPLVSWIIGPGGFTEHPPSSPANGELLLKELLDGLAANPEVYNSTVFIFNYDENDGFFDHAMPILPPPGTANEFVGSLPVGLGIRVPAIMVSPWSRGGRVCSQVFDHTSVIRFLETWTGVIDTNISAWRRQVCGDLTSAFDFAHPNTDYPILDGVDEVDCPSGQTPPVPSPQTFPVQESGARIQLPIPYQPNAACALNAAANTFSITMTNSGAASFHFAVYPNLDSSGPWPFDVGTDASASVSFSTSGTGGDYDFTCYGPDGFQRRFAGNVTLDALKIEAVSYVNPGNAGIKIELVNSSVATVAFTVTNGYTISSGTYVVPAHSTGIISPGSESNDGYYDVTVTASADPGFVRRFMGRVETVAPGDSLVSSKNPCDVGDSVTFTFTAHGYGTPSGTVQFSANGAPTGSPEPLVNGTASFTIPSFGCDNASIAAVYSGDLFNTATTNTLLQVVSTPPPVITLNGSDPMTNWLGTPFLDPGATAENLCAEPLPVTTNQVVNSSIAGQYSVQYIAGNPGLLATNTRTVWVVQEIPPTVSAGQMLESGQFQFSFSGPATQPYRVLATTNLMDSDSWIEVASGAFGDQAAVFTETNVPAQSARFYRLVSP